MYLNYVLTTNFLLFIAKKGTARGEVANWRSSLYPTKVPGEMFPLKVVTEIICI